MHIFIIEFLLLNSNITNAGKFYGIDTSRLLANVTQTTIANYTATEDCFCVLYSNANGDKYPYIDNVTLFNYIINNQNGALWMIIPLKQGQKLTYWSNTYSGENNSKLRVFGVKKS